ncbi:MAG: SAM-dependent methyltransferase, partial [Blastocatellia bacterium]|nr:SAM-dependent methyltransferase [Blastocatellia bacterium]
MLLDVTRARSHLKNLDFKTLFIEEMGWDKHSANLSVTISDKKVELTAFAEKRGVVAFTCSPSLDGRIPDYATRRKIETEVAKSAHEHIIIYLDANKTTQVWQWVKREAGKPTACREHTYHRDQPGDALIQKLQAIAFSFEEEEELTLLDVTSRVRAAFDVERITKRFYDRFKTEHAAFLKFIKGIPDEEMQRWYASVMINRLMFIYFVQKKGFLNKDENYLRSKLEQSEEQGKNLYYSKFLCALFFEGFAKK